jgi:hypothetical protein
LPFRRQFRPSHLCDGLNFLNDPERIRHSPAFLSR